MNGAASKAQIVVFSTVYLPMIGGAELAIRDIAERLADHYDFTVITARYRRTFPVRERMGHVSVRRVGFGIPFDKYLLPFLGVWAAHFEIRHPALNWGMMASFGGIAARFFNYLHPDIPFLLTLQEGDPEEYLLHGRWGLMGFWFRFIVRAADRIQVISDHLKRVAIKAGAVAKNIDVVPNGVDLEVFGREYPDAERDVRAEFGLPSDAKIAITASRLVHKNAVDIMIRAMAEIPNEHLIIAGVGPEEAKLRALTHELKLDTRVHFLGDVSHAKLARLYAASHLFVRPSRSEGLGSAFLEAMAAGLAIIGTDVGGIPDFLTHNETGVIVKVDDVADLARQMEHLFSDAEFRARIAESGRRLAHDTYSWESVAKQMNRIFHNLFRA